MSDLQSHLSLLANCLAYTMNNFVAQILLKTNVTFYTRIKLSRVDNPELCPPFAHPPSPISKIVTPPFIKPCTTQQKIRKNNNPMGEN